jgi:dienelactone hydrolase
MANREEVIEISVAERQIAGTIVAPSVLMPGALFIHGWTGDQSQYLARAREIAALGCVCLTFDLYGHAKTAPYLDTVTREHSLADVLAAYDALVGLPVVDRTAIAVIGSSYGGYLAAILSTLRPIKWLGLRAPALYQDADWVVPRQLMDHEQLMAYRRGTVEPETNRALSACAKFDGDALLVESEHDDIVPAPVLANYRAAFGRARSLTCRMLAGADHSLSDQACQDAYTAALTKWLSEMLIGERRAKATEGTGE